MEAVNSDTADRWLTRAEAAEYLRIQEQTLSNWAVNQKHLPFTKIGKKCVRYKLSDLREFMAKNRVPAK